MSQERATVVVIGNGMVGHRFCERLAERDPEGRFSIVTFCEEDRPAYDRVQLSSFFSGKTADELSLADIEWYRERGIELYIADRAARIDREKRIVYSAKGREIAYDYVVLATGSVPFVPPVAGMDAPGVFVYRTIEDLEAIRAWAPGARRAAVIGGGLLGLEAAKAAVDMELQTSIVEFADRLMVRQLDARGGAILRSKIEALGVAVLLSRDTAQVLADDRVKGLRFVDGEVLETDMVIVSAGIRPRDDLARACDLAVDARGGVLVDASMRTSDPNVFAIGECAKVDGTVYGLVAPGYEMAEVVASVLLGEERSFEGGDLSTKLKLLGVDVASFGQPFAEAAPERAAREVIYEDARSGIYKKLVVSADGKRLLGGMLVGDADPYANLLTLTREEIELPESVESLLFPSAGEGGPLKIELPDSAQVCSCNNVTKGEIRAAIHEEDLTGLDKVKVCTRAGTGCGGCLPIVAQILAAELEAAGISVDRNLCEHFPYTRQELFHIVQIAEIRTFEALLQTHGRGSGCEICKPAVASILASLWNEMVLDRPHRTLQDTNDRFLANIQRGGTYSVIPRVPGGEITPDKLIALGLVAKKYDLYTKITGGQRVDLLGARLDQLPDIWADLVAAGFESGHAYGKALRTVKSCVGTTWCRYGVQDSTGMAIRLEERYRGIRSPHKLKSAVSGCVRECAEAQGKDFGVIATEKGWNLYVCGNGGARPRHADLLAADIDDETLVRYIDRFLMYYIRTADRLQRTASWLEALEGGIEQLKRVVVEDALGIASELEAQMQLLVSSYRCEWREVVENPALQQQFRHFVNSDHTDDELDFVIERGQKRPADWTATPSDAPGQLDVPAEERAEWVRIAAEVDFPVDGGLAARHGDLQIAVFNFASRGEWYATQNRCPHMRDMVLSRGIVGDEGGEPKLACPLHKKTFSLCSGKGLSDPAYSIRTYPVKLENGDVFVKLPPAETAPAP